MSTNDETSAGVSNDEVQARRERELTDVVVASFDDAQNPRLKEVVTSLVEHLHAFVREARPTEAEWRMGIDFLTEVGHLCDDQRQEFILLSDVLGVSMQTVTVNHEAYGAATESTVFGPFFVENAPSIPLGGDIAGDAPGQACWVEGTVRDPHGDAVPHAVLEVWEADDDGFYDVQYEDGRVRGRANLRADEHGSFRFWALTPTPYPIPHDGPVGRLLAASGRSPMRASHLHFMVSADGFSTLVTHIFVEGDELLDSDSVFGVRETLVKQFVQHDRTEPTPDGRAVGPDGWASTRFDIVLAPAARAGE